MAPRAQVGAAAPRPQLRGQEEQRGSAVAAAGQQAGREAAGGSGGRPSGPRVSTAWWGRSPARTRVPAPTTSKTPPRPRAAPRGGWRTAAVAARRSSGTCRWTNCPGRAPSAMRGRPDERVVLPTPAPLQHLAAPGPGSSAVLMPGLEGADGQVAGQAGLDPLDDGGEAGQGGDAGDVGGHGGDADVVAVLPGPRPGGGVDDQVDLPARIRSTTLSGPSWPLRTTSASTPLRRRTPAVPVVATRVKPRSARRLAGSTMARLSALRTDRKATPLSGRAP